MNDSTIDVNITTTIGHNSNNNNDDGLEEVSLAITIAYFSAYLITLLVVSLFAAKSVRNEMKAMKKTQKTNKNSMYKNQQSLEMTTKKTKSTKSNGKSTIIVTGSGSITSTTPNEKKTIANNSEATDKTDNNTGNYPSTETRVRTETGSVTLTVATTATTATTVTTTSAVRVAPVTHEMEDEDEDEDDGDENDYQMRNSTNTLDGGLTRIDQSLYAANANKNKWKWHTPFTKWFKEVRKKRRVYIALLPHIFDQAVKCFLFCFVLFCFFC